LPGGETEIVLIPGERNSIRFPTYVRLDFKARKSFALPKGRLWLNVEVLNLTDRENACCIKDFVIEEQSNGDLHVRREFDYWLGITPAVSLLWEF